MVIRLRQKTNEYTPPLHSFKSKYEIYLAKSIVKLSIFQFSKDHYYQTSISFSTPLVLDLRIPLLHKFQYKTKNLIPLALALIGLTMKHHSKPRTLTCPSPSLWCSACPWKPPQALGIRRQPLCRCARRTKCWCSPRQARRHPGHLPIFKQKQQNQRDNNRT